MLQILNQDLFWLISLIVVFLVALVTYCYDTWNWHNAQGKPHSLRQLPPKAPTLVPLLGCIIPFLWNPGSYLKRVS